MKLLRLAGLAAAWAALFSPAVPAATVQERLGHPADARLLILHADDLGMSHSVNRATFEALESGWITSASILVPCPWFPEVATWARSHPQADLGIHLALNSEWTAFRWRPLSAPDAVRSLVDGDGYLPLVETTVAERARPREVERELRAQIDAARRAGIAPTHLDSHMAALFQTRPLYEVYRRLGAAYRVPLLLERLGRRGGADSPWASDAARDALVDRVVSIDPGVTPEGWPGAYRDLLAPLPPGVYQLIVHLGYDDEEMRGATADHPDWGARWRQSDLDLVRSPEFREFLRQQRFVLVGWRDLARAAAGR